MSIEEQQAEFTSEIERQLMIRIDQLNSNRRMRLKDEGGGLHF